LVESLGSGQRAVVITHDCDLLSDNELYVEIILSNVVPESNISYTHARHPRILYLEFIGAEGELICLSLEHVNRKSINKNEFGKVAEVDPDLSLPTVEKRFLKQWLAARYGRPAFPTSFENRLRDKSGDKSVQRQLQKVLRQSANDLLFFFDLGENRSIELPEGTEYPLSISVVYDAEEGGKDARDLAETAASEIKQIFQGAYGDSETSEVVSLETCEAVSNTEMTLADTRRVDQWQS
jgi:hypothetical protein